ncbi:alpha-tectorin-like [Sceloporus undulatus]|uniref:alpha-tectorin-like n=1 Tax=Sceloporus undulatus TaxID=8520 RepID=UPI001C4D2F10|nr:alpha-tectorin-like [Sceloporus undulatus]
MVYEVLGGITMQAELEGTCTYILAKLQEKNTDLTPLTVIECHAIVDPNVYLNKCVLELCKSGEDKEAMCQVIHSYVAACQASKVKLQPWRSPTFCPLTCPANSYYTTCSNICETNCAGITDRLKCPEHCVEGCQCNDGFFFDGLECVSLDKCGCFENGRYFPFLADMKPNDDLAWVLLKSTYFSGAVGETCWPWRSPTFCPLTCPANSYYTTCSNICETNCAGLTDHLQCPESCAEGCQCNDGFFFDGLECVSLDKCGCFENGRYLLHGESYLTPDCKAHCTCQNNNSVTCRPQGCAVGEVCELRDGLRGCYRTEGHCTLMLGAHLSSFDGLSGNFLSPGIYQLVSLCDINSDDWFRVVVSVASCPPDGTIAPMVLHVFLKDLFISVNGQNNVWVNGLPISIPHKGTKLVISSWLVTLPPQLTTGSSISEFSSSSEGGIDLLVRGVVGALETSTMINDDLKGPGGVE